MPGLVFTSRYDDWTESPDGHYVSPRWREDQHDQVLIFAGRAKDGSLEAEITPLEGGKGMGGDDKKESGLLVRNVRSSEGYWAGLGAFGAKFSIAKMTPTGWQLLASSGNSSSVRYGATYRLKIEFVGNQLNLYENDVLLISAIDDTFPSGPIGLRTRKTNARFANVIIKTSKAVCFVVMPFASELDFVYRTIRETVTDCGFQCVRGDERFVSRPVIDDIRDAISRADLIIVDFTHRNPNVYYEAGLADAWKRNWVVIAQSVDDLTFDVKHIRTIFYSDRMGADVTFREELQRAINETITPTSSLR